VGNLVCPRCGVFTAPILGRFHAQVQIRSGGSYRYESGTSEAVTREDGAIPAYGIIVCQACGRHFVAESDDNGEWMAVYPIRHKPAAKELPEPVKSELGEANLCFAIGANVGCILLCRVALIALQRQQGVSSLKELKEKGAISELLYRQADEVRLWANVLGHDDIDPAIIEKEDVEELITYLEALMDAVYSQPARLGLLTEKRKQLKQK
jgi:hypothetical protein